MVMYRQIMLEFHAFAEDLAVETIAVVWPCFLNSFWINYPFLVTIDRSTSTQILGLQVVRTVRTHHLLDELCNLICSFFRRIHF